MRLSCLLLLIPILFAATACSQPQCQPDEVKVGIICHPLRTQSDASADSLGSSIVDGGSTDGAADERDAANGRDTSTSGATTEDASAPAELDAILDTLPGGPPSFQFRADTVTLRGSNVATIPNRRGSDALVIAAGALAAPASDALFGGAQSLTFSGTQWLDSNLAASEWTFLHDGTGGEVFHVYAPTAVATTYVIAATIDTTLGAMWQWNGVTAARVQINNATPTALFATGGGGKPTTNVATYQDAYYSDTTPLKYAIYAEDALAASSVTSAAPPARTSANPFRLGALVSGAAPASMKWSETLIFPRVLHEYERQLVREYISARYGIAAPGLTGPDREIMSLLPFSWFDAAAYDSSGGKVTAFPDRAQPGHTFAQGTTANQVRTPATDADIRTQRVATFVNASSTRYVSSLPASAWRFMHGDSGGNEWRAVFRPTQNGLFVFATRTGQGAGFDVSQQSAQLAWGVYNATQSVFNATGGSTPLNAWTCIGGSMSAFTNPQWELRVAGVAVSSDTYVHEPARSDPGASLTVGAYGNGVSPFDGSLASLLIFNRVLSTSERARLKAALAARFGVSE